MAHNPEWHRAYLTLENAASMATREYHEARRGIERKRPAKAAQGRYDAALEAMRATNKARYDFEMAGAVVVDIATLPTAQWAKAMQPR